jgi:hypothetical protein
MNITFLKPNNNQFPSSVDSGVGDITVMSNGDMFCYMGDMWKMLGGRWVPAAIKQSFINYIRSGWPDSKSLEFDLEGVFMLSVFEELTDVKEAKNGDIIKDPIWVKNFSEAIVKTCSLLEKLNGKSVLDSKSV